MSFRIIRRGFSVFAVFGAAAMFAGAMNQGCASSSQPEVPAAAPEVKPVAASVQEIKTLDFKRRNDPDYAPVTLPHTMNAANGTGVVPLERGDGYYRYALDLQESDLVKDYIIQFEEVGQTAEVSLNGTLLHTNRCGYTPFAVKLDGLKAGHNEVTIHTNNRIDNNMIPNSGDFNFCNGVYGRAYLLSGNVYFDPQVYGIDKMHVIPLSVKQDQVRFGIAASVFSREITAGTTVTTTLKDADGGVVLTETAPLAVAPGGNEFYREYTFKSPVLWQGKENPYLYTVDVALSLEGQELDRITIPYGFRDIRLPYSAKDNLLRLNGKKVSLRGVSYHQDSPGVAVAMTDEDRKRDQEIMLELGFNWLRCAHYPHNVKEFADYDRIGMMCQTEIPWVNGFTNSPAFEQNVMQFTRDMIVNLYNHPSIILWGLSNEIFYSWSGEECIRVHNDAYTLARRLDPYRPVGHVEREQEVRNGASNGLISDWFGNNTYPGWYSPTTFENTEDGVTDTQVLAKFYLHGITEYGYGGNPFQHNDDFMTLHPKSKTNKSGTSNDTGGWLHPEEYQTLGHIYSWNKIAGTPEGRRLTFTSLWILFDFAVGSRNEGDTPGINDKGLVTRDRKTKKDAFYFYKCIWNPENEVHIMSTRWEKRDTKDIAITVFSNGDKVELYQNKKLVQVLDKPTDTINNVVWKFDPVPFSEDARDGAFDEFSAVGYRKGLRIGQHNALFTTTAK
jgi:beta-galactosidase